VFEDHARSVDSHLRRRRPVVSSALARTEVIRSLLPFGDEAVARGHEVLATLDLVRINDRILRAAGELEPAELRSLDAIHLASAQQFEAELRHIVTYDTRMIDSAHLLGLETATPT